MTVRMGLIKKVPGWTDEEFRTYWRQQHGALAARAPGLRGYWQNAVTDRLQRGIDFARGPWDLDGFSQLWFDDQKQADHAFGQSGLAGDLIADENRFIGQLHILTTRQSVVVPVAEAARGRLLKRMSILKRRPDVSEDDFRREWTIHAGHVQKMPGVAGYRQNLVVARERTKGQPCGYDALPIDGIVEMWFESADTLNAAFSSAQGQVTMRHASIFIAEITAFVVAEHRVV